MGTVEYVGIVFFLVRLVQLFEVDESTWIFKLLHKSLNILILF
jgi:hypothetical protein